jgi:RNA polymerase sigma-B factor
MQSAEFAEACLEEWAGLTDDNPARRALRELVIEGWMPLVRHLASRYAGPSDPAVDVVRMAAAGLIDAVDRYRLDCDEEFAARAVPAILKELKRSSPDCAEAPEIFARLRQLLGRSPTVTDASQHLHLSEEHFIEGLETGWARSARVAEQGRFGVVCGRAA